MTPGTEAALSADEWLSGVNRGKVFTRIDKYSSNISEARVSTSAPQRNPHSSGEAFVDWI